MERIEPKAEASAETDALSSLREKYLPSLLRLAENICGKGEAALECVEHAFSILSGIIPEHDGGAEAFARLACSVRARALERAKALVGRSRSAEFSVISAEIEGAIPLDMNADDTLDGKPVSGIIGDFLAELSDELRAVFMQRYFFMEPISAVSEKLGVDEDKAERLLSKARRALKSYLKGVGYTV